MITTVTKSEFTDAFLGRGDWDDSYKNNFSYYGLQSMFEYLEEYEESCEEQIEFDRVGIACEYSEYKNLKEFQEDCGSDIETLEELSEHTTVIPIEKTDGFIIQDF